MSENRTTGPQGVLLTTDLIRRWESDIARIDGEIEDRIKTRGSIEKKLAAARTLLEMADGDEFQIEPETAVAAGAVAEMEPLQEESPLTVKAPEHQRRISGKLTWTDIVEGIVAEGEMGLTYAEVRAKAVDSQMGDRLKVSDKGYHNAIGRLARSGTIIRQHGRLFTPTAFKKFMQAVDAGETSTTVAMPFAHSPMGEAILKIVWEQPGKIGKDIIVELRKDVEFNATLTPHETGAYNIIARLVKRRQIIRRDDGGIIPGPDFPRDLIGQLPNEAGALNGHTASAPFAREVTASLFDNQRRLTPAD